MRTVKPLPFPTQLHVQSSKQIGEAIRAARTQSGVTLEMAALTLGISKQTLSDIEHGKPTVSLGNAILAANGLGVSLFALPAQLREQAKFTLGKLK